MYGNQWVSVFGDVDGPAFNGWSSMLETITEMELAGALKLCETRAGTYPPGFPEFRGMCMAARAAARPNVTEKRIAQEKAAGQPISMIEHLARVATTPTSEREMGRILRISDSPTTRGPSPDDVEPFGKSYHNCGLDARWSA